MRKRLSALALSELLILLVVVILAAAIGIPSFAKARRTSQKNACINTLRQIDKAAESWALEGKRAAGTQVVEREVDMYIKGGHPSCPGGGVYSYGRVGERPTCTIPSHTL